MNKDKWIEKFKKEALPKIISKVAPQKLLLFGSRIHGKPHQDSDIDVILVSSYFENIPFVKRIPLMLKKVRFKKHIDFICYDPQEFERMKNNSIVLKEALDNGESLL